MLAPGDPERPVQFTDVRDLAAWLVRSLDPAGASPLTGVYNAVGPGREESLKNVLGACLRAAKDVNSTQTDIEFVWADENFLREELAQVEEEARPLWFPEDQIPFARVDSSKALAKGLRFRSSYETAKDTLLWRKTQDEPRLSPHYGTGCRGGARERPSELRRARYDLRATSPVQQARAAHGKPRGQARAARAPF